jgi:hypothetical protein
LLIIEVDGQSRDLELLGSVFSTVREDGNKVASTFGQNRIDALYLLPIYAANKKGIIIADFAANRNRFMLYELTGSKGKFMRKWSRWPAPDVRPKMPALKEFINREYPGFLAD